MKIFRRIGLAITLIIYFGLCALIVYLSCANGVTSTAQSNVITEIIAESLTYINVTIDPTSSEVKHLVRKLIGHFGLFLVTGVFGIFSIILLRRNRRIKTFSFIALYIFGAFIAIITEVIQMVSEGRGPSANDSMINLSGYSIPFVIYLIYMIYIHYKEKKEGYLLEL